MVLLMAGKTEAFKVTGQGFPCVPKPSLCSRHGLTRHQFYLQLRKDILEERLYCNDETALKLGALALQAELGNYAPEVWISNTIFLRSLSQQLLFVT